MPARVYFSRGFWFYVTSEGKWIKLGKEKPEALRAYAELLSGDGRVRMREIFLRYARDILPTKAPSTRKTQERRLEVLTQVFGALSPDQISSGEVAQYLDESPAKVQANRDIALLSHVFTKAVRWRLAKANPCLGVERNAEAPRDRYVTHEEYLAVFEAGSPVIQAMMALAYVTGQRESDLLKLRRAQLTSEGIHFRQGKTGKRLVVSWSSALRTAVDLAGQLPAEGVGSLFVICRRDGQPYSADGFQTLWQRHQIECLKQGLIAERFTFHDLRAKAGSDAKDGRLLGHIDARTLNRVYRRAPEKVAPTS
ncbi:tyrosine-type recombinase/integrase [Solimonas fluminis]|nr:tyrosine-type recombinase/integrase [Solimonas fluminis]